MPLAENPVSGGLPDTPSIAGSPYYTDAITPVVGLDSTFVAVDYDAEEKWIYYSDVKKDVIMRAKPDGTRKSSYLVLGLNIIISLSLGESSTSIRVSVQIHQR